MAGILTVILTGILVVILCTELLVRNLPESIRASMEANCRRLDGSLSRNRQRIERKATNELRRNLAIAFLFVLTPVSCLIYWTHANIIPFSIGRDALISFRVSEEKWKESLETSGVEADSPVSKRTSSCRCWDCSLTKPTSLPSRVP